MIDFDLVEDYLDDAKAIAWDTCHKIYLLMDDEQVVAMRGYGYGDANDPDSLITKDQMSASEMLTTIKKWFEESCSLRFVNAVETNLIDPNAGFTTLIEQGAADECDDCGERGCAGVCADYDDEPEDDDEEDED
jgi:hypothetical protein